MGTRKTKEPKQVGNACHVIVSFGGVPCAIDTYPDERMALKRYERLKEIEVEVSRQGNGGLDVSVEEEWNDKSRVKTSCSGLPRCRIVNTQLSLSVVRGPVYEFHRTPDEIPFVAVMYHSGTLKVVAFDEKSEAKKTYEALRKEHEGDIEESTDEINKVTGFSNDDISVAVGVAELLHKGESCQLV